MSPTIVAAIVGGLVGGALAFTIGWFAGYSWGRKYMEEYIRLGEWHLKPRTNADRLRYLTDEELAKEVYRGCARRNCPDGVWDAEMTESEEDAMCLKCWLAWLKSPAKGERE